MNVVIEKPSTNGSLSVQVRSGVELINPEKAKMMLATKSADGLRQRPLNKGHVEYLSAQMREGKWILQYEPIIVAESGFVTDGQHRLKAVIDSGTTQHFLVVRGTRESDIRSIGIGKKRSASDVLAMEGYTSTKLLASTLVYLYTYYNRGHFEKAVSLRSEKKIPEYEYPSLVKKYPGVIQAVSYGVSHNNSSPWLRGAPLCALWYILGQISLDDRNIFFGKLMSGTGLSKDDPVFLLRERLIKIHSIRLSRSISSTYSRAHMIALVIKAWNAMRSGLQIKQLKYSSSESFPQPV